MTPSRLIIHCSDTRNGRATTAREIDRWHAARSDMGGRSEPSIGDFAPQYPYCGYHGIITLSGEIVRTRADSEMGSHCAGYNTGSLGFCLVGRDRFSPVQWDALEYLVKDCLERYPGLQVFGHRDFNREKTCPGFHVKQWLEGGMRPLTDHLLI